MSKDNTIEIRDFSEVVYFQEGPGVRNWQFTTEGIKLINIKNIVNDKLKLSNTNKYLDSEEVKNKYQHFLLNQGDYVLASSGATWGKIAEIENKHLPLCLNTSIIRLVSKDEKILAKRYLWYFIKSHLFIKQIERLITGSAQPNFGPSHLIKIKIMTPEIDKQIKIANVLDKSQELIDKRKAQIKALDELIKSVFYDMFGDTRLNKKKWKVYDFKNVCVNKDTFRVPLKQADRDKKEGEYPYYGATGIIDYIDDYCFEGEHLLIAEDGKNLESKNKDIAFKANKKFWVNNHAHVVAYNGIANLDYLRYFINNIDLKPFITGIDQLKLNRNNMDKIKVNIPPIELQNKFAHTVENIEKQKEQLQESLKQLEDNFNSLMQKAFKGELFN